MDVSIVGACGSIGKQAAVSLIESRVLQPSIRLQLVGHRGGASERALPGFAADLQDAYAEIIPEIDVVSDPEDVLGDIIIIAAGATVPCDPHENLPRRLLAESNKSLFEIYARVISEHGHGEEIILVVSNPVELGVAIFARHHPRARVIGMGGYLDTLRFRYEIANELGIRRQNVQGLVLGEHGPAMVPCWSTVSAFGFDSNDGRQRLKSLRRSGDPSPLEALDEIRHTMIEHGAEAAFARLSRYGADLRTYVKPFAAQICGAKTTLGTSEMIVRLVETIMSGNQTLAAAQVMLEGEFLGIHGITGVPVVLSNRGIERVEPLQLWSEEADAVVAAAAATETAIGEFIS